MILRKLSGFQYGMLVGGLIVVVVFLGAVSVGIVRQQMMLARYSPLKAQSSVIPQPQVSLTPEQKVVQDDMIKGLQAQQQQQYDQARVSYNAAIKANPTEIGAYNNLGVTYLSQKNWQAAIDPLQKAISLDATYMAAHVNLGLAYCHLGNLTAAKAELDTLQKNNVTQVDFLTNLIKGGCVAQPS